MGKGDARKKYRANSMGQQWWRKLSLPRRGKKDTLLAPSALTGKLPDARTARVTKRRMRLQKAVEAPRSARSKSLAIADWVPKRGLALVVSPRGNLLSSMGFFEGGDQWLFPEEATYLVDRAQLDLRVDGVPASLQRAWGFMVDGITAISLEEYCAYSHLRRVGYVVRRFKLDDIDESTCEKDDEDEEGGADDEGDSRDGMRRTCDGAEDESGGEENGGKDGDCVVPSLLSGGAKEQVSTAVGGEKNVTLSDGGGDSNLVPSFSVWRVGAYRRRNTRRPLFHLLVSRYEDAPPSHEDLSRLLDDFTGKTRLRSALIDRGVVVLVDIANKATPLSKRYADRLPLVDAPCASVSPGPCGANGIVPGGSVTQDGRMGSATTVPDVSAGKLTELVFAASKALMSTDVHDLQHVWQWVLKFDATWSQEQVHEALLGLAREDRVVLSSGNNPTVYVACE